MIWDTKKEDRYCTEFNPYSLAADNFLHLIVLAFLYTLP